MDFGIIARPCTHWLLLLLSLAFPALADAQFSYTTEYNYTTNNGVITTNGTVTITGYTGTGGTVVIPCVTNGYPVTTIGNLAFVFNTSLTNVVIPNSILSIEDSAFLGCYNLACLKFGTNLVSIGNFTFQFCTSLTNIAIPDSVESMGDDSFSECYSLVSIWIGGGVTNVGDEPLMGPGGAVTDDGAFLNCTNLTAINVDTNNSFFSSLNGALYDKGPTTLILFPQGYGGSYTIPDSVTSIEDNAFANARLGGVTLGRGVTNLWYEIEYPSGASGSNSVFSSCLDLTNITVDAESPVFSSLNGVLFDKDQTTLLECPCGLAGTYTVPDSVTVIGDQAFAGCASLTSVIVSSGVTNIGDFTFSGCSSLTSAYFDGNAPPDDGTVFSGDSDTIYYLFGTTGWGPTFGGVTTVQETDPSEFNYTANDNAITITGYTGSGGALIIPDMINGYPVASIGDYSFYYNTSIASVTIPSTVTGIGDGAFLNCLNLDNLTMANGVTTIGEDAFTDTRLNTITIPATITNIADGAFDGCTSMTTITVSPQNSFYSSTNGVLFDKAQTRLVKYPDGIYGTYAIPANVMSIEDNAFADCGLTSVVIPNGITTIPQNTFFGCASLTNIIIPNSVTSIQYEAFGSCASLQSITIPNSVTNIGFGVFSSCTSLTNVIISTNVTSIGQSAFADCESLTSIVLPSSVVNLVAYTFVSCFDLTSVYFQGNAPDFGPYIFDGTGNLTLYYLPGTTGWGSNYAGIPIEPWLPIVQTGSGFGVQTNQFGFNIDWASGQTVVVQASTDLSNPVWNPIATNTLTSGSFYFTDPQWTNYPGRFYRVSSQ